MPFGLDHDQPVRHRQRGLDRIGQPALDVGPHDQPVDDDLDRVLFLLVELDLVRQVAHVAVDPRANETLPRRVLELLAVDPLAAADDRRQHLDPAILRCA
ncbi:MAG TPA: hypothetical protein VD788_00995 [Candidatus Polarisedimenticolaceae bacterium]|nr:hypothetical protein [Candidatus Polarisedimenticolaceae bacterium]